MYRIAIRIGPALPVQFQPWRGQIPIGILVFSTFSSSLSGILTNCSISLTNRFSEAVSRFLSFEVPMIFDFSVCFPVSSTHLGQRVFPLTDEQPFCSDNRPIRSTTGKK